MPSASTRSKTALAALPRCAERACPGHDRPTSGSRAASPTGAPMRSARPASTCSSRSMPARSARAGCAPTCSIPASCAPGCASAPFPARTRAACRDRKSIGDAFLALVLPECTRNGEVVMASAVSLRGECVSEEGSSSPRQSRPLHPPPVSPFLPVPGRDPRAVGSLRQMPEPVLDIRDEPLGGDQIPDRMECSD